jgi:hypothetical protein
MVKGEQVLQMMDGISEGTRDARGEVLMAQFWTLVYLVIALVMGNPAAYADLDGASCFR